MAIELRVLSGSRSGQSEVLDLPVITIGRHPKCDFRFDAVADLDVSARHAELRAADGGGWTIRDGGSTNGTFVNGKRVTDSEPLLHDGDVIAFGELGPRVEVRSVASNATGAGGANAQPVPATTIGGTRKKPSTDERVAMAVRRQTKGMRRTLAAAVAVLAAGVGIAYWIGHRESRAQLTELMQVLARSESTTTQLQAQLIRMGDTSFANALRRQSAEMAARVRSSSGSGASTEELLALREEIVRAQALQQGLALMDVSTIAERNDPGVAFLVTELDGKPYGSTAFGVSPNGLLITNRHNVRSESGAPPTRLGVKYANTDNLRRARVVKVSDDKDVDLALVQIEEAGVYPTVSGVARSVEAVHTGAPVVTIGFPHALDTPMDGNIIKTTLAGGTVSKKIPSLLQIDSYAGHGSSGSPIFDTSGNVIGVVWGGAPDSQGRIVYAVPSDKVAAFLPKEIGGIVR